MRTAPKPAFCTSVGIALFALLALVGASPAAFASESGTAPWTYKITGVDYNATGQLAGGRVPGTCVGIAFWEGEVSTNNDTEVAPLTLGKVSLTVHAHGTSGSGLAKIEVKSKLSNAFHRITTACDESEFESAFTMTPCTGSLDSKMHVSVSISGGVGTPVKLLWDFFQFGGASGTLVTDSFSCVEPFKFPDKTCTTKSSLGALNHKKVSLPFKCFYSTLTPPPGSNYTHYESNAYATGVLNLERKK